MVYYDPTAAVLSFLGIVAALVFLVWLIRRANYVNDHYDDMEIGALHGYVRKKHPEILKELAILEVSEKSKFRRKLEEKIVEEYFPENKKQ